MRRFWLVKSEPEEYSIDDLAGERDGSACWDGVRNYQARNFMRDEMKLGDGVLFYHSNCKPPGIVGIARVCRESYPDHTQFDPKSKKYDPKSSPEKPRWFMVDLKFEKCFTSKISLEELRQMPGLEQMLLLQRGNRLSVMPVIRTEWEIINACRPQETSRQR